MDYEIISLKEKKLIGLTARTKNSDPNMGQIIGSLWGTLFEGGVYPTIENKVNANTIGLYSEYSSDVNGEYSVTVGCEVSDEGKLPENAVAKIIPAGKYAKFIVKGNMVTAVADFWHEVWQINLDRSYTGDFEEYIASDSCECDPDNMLIHIFIALK